MQITRRALLAGTTVLFSACSKFRSYDGPQVTRIEVQKSALKMYLLHGEEVLRDFDISLGFAPSGPKQVEGDGKTPEGRYFIDRRNPDSMFHLSLGISYPNAEDVARAISLGQSPGGDIFIHGQKSWMDPGDGNWTAGCIAVTNREMEDIYAMVGRGTPIDIFA